MYNHEKIAELVEKLNGCDYREGPRKEHEVFAKENNLVIVFGYSDDCIELRGTVVEELGAPGLVYLNASGIINNKCDDDSCPYFHDMKGRCITIEAEWCKSKDLMWTYKTDIPHMTFQMVEDGEVAAEGIVFSMQDLNETYILKQLQF